VNQRQLHAICMLYMSQEGVDVLGQQGAARKASLEKMVRSGFLKRLPNDPGQGPGTFGHYRLSAAGVTCSIHSRHR
jgi:hypothetical protein